MLQKSSAFYVEIPFFGLHLNNLRMLNFVVKKHKYVKAPLTMK